MPRAVLTPLRLIPTPGGDVRHAMKVSDAGFVGFGEAYFSTVQEGAVKGWKRHREMTLNVIVPCGEIRFLVIDERSGEREAFHLTPDRSQCYARLTVEPGLWMAFGGVGQGLNLLLNIASIQHDPTEAETRPMEEFPWTWMG